jgi:hypothetical protein
MLKANPKMLSAIETQRQFPALERKVIAAIANADSTAEALVAYEQWSGIVPDWKFVLASEKGSRPGMSVNRTFPDGSVVRGLFSKARVIVLDVQTMDDMRLSGKASYRFDYSIALDTQALSYLEPFMAGNTAKLPADFRDIFAFIARDEVNVDPTPYLTENLPNILEEKNVEAIRRKLEAYEILRTIDSDHLLQTGSIRSIATGYERKTNVDSMLAGMITNASDPAIMTAMLYRRTLMYCLLLKMVTIQLRNPRGSLVSKIHDFVEFSDNTLQTIFARETIVAYEYFSKGQKLEFFGAIQKSSADRMPVLIDKLKNMAWDFWHIRYIEDATKIEGSMAGGPEREVRYFFPSLLTCDKRFIEVIDFYPLKSYAYHARRDELIPFAELDWIKRVAGSEVAEPAFIERYYSSTAVKRRENSRKNVKARIDAIAHDLEEDFFKVAVNK